MKPEGRHSEEVRDRDEEESGNDQEYWDDESDDGPVVMKRKDWATMPTFAQHSLG